MPNGPTLKSSARMVDNGQTYSMEWEGPESGFTVPEKRTGDFINLQGGVRFRKATPRALANWRVERGASESTSGRYYIPRDNKWASMTVSSSAGGLGISDFLSANPGSAFSQMTGVGMGINWTRNVSIPPDARNEAVVKALNRIADGKANMGENLGTMGMTLRMLKNPVSFLAKGLHKVYSDRSLRPFIRESRRSLERKGPLNFAAERYLEYVYGFKPLVQDIHGLIEMAKEKGELPLLLSGYGKALRKASPRPHTWNRGSGRSNVTFRITGGEANAKIQCKLYAQIDPDSQGLRSLNQLGLLNPVALAWELASFSFVVDWVLPIGPVLNALSAPAGLKFVNGSISNRVKMTATGTSNLSFKPEVSKSPANCKLILDAYNREVISGWPKVGFWFDQDPFRGDRILKATALSILQLRALR